MSQSGGNTGTAHSLEVILKLYPNMDFMFDEELRDSLELYQRETISRHVVSHTVCHFKRKLILIAAKYISRIYTKHMTYQTKLTFKFIFPITL